MKKYFFFLAFLCVSKFSNAQLTVTTSSTNGTVCLGNSSTLTATATPVGYTMTAITTSALAPQGINVLAEMGAATVPLSFGSLDDGRWDNISIPFSFRFYGTIFNAVNISTNGWVGLGSTNSTATGYGFALPNASAPNNVIHAATSDLIFSGAGNTGILEYFTAGTYPNRKFVVNYGDAQFRPIPSSGAINVQVILYETTNVIEIHTTDCTNTTTAKAQGIENSGGTLATVATGRNNTTNWAITPSSSAYRFTPDNITYSWSPATGLNTTSGAIVIATPTANTTYTVTALNTVNSQSGSTTVTVNVNTNSFILAAVAGGSAVCQNISVGSNTSYRDGTCKLIATIVPAGANPVSNSINTCTQLDTGATKKGTADLYAARKYDMEPIVNPATSTANITLYYLQSEFDNFNLKATDSGHHKLPAGPSDAAAIASLRLNQFHGTGTKPGNYSGAMETFSTATSGFTVAWNATRSWWEITVPVTGFSGFYLTSTKLAPLPINMEYFKAVQSGRRHLLSWKATSTSAEAKFAVERGTDGQHFTSLKNIIADQARCNQPFDYTDEAPLPGKNYYRIVMTDIDGKTTFSNIILLTQRDKQFELVSLNPNITSLDVSALKIDAAAKNELLVIFTDNAGRTVKKQSALLLPGANTIQVNTAGLAAGVYQLTAYIPGEVQQTIKFIKQ
jgi:hypothetical protein